MTVSRIFAAVVLLSCFSAFASSQKETISIDVPHDLAPVPWKTCISGTSTDADAILAAVVHPLGGDYYVQPPITLRGNTFESMIYVGESTPAIYEGIHFEVRIFQTKLPLKEGLRLANWPEEGAVSPLIRVIRKDGAPSGCSEAVSSSHQEDAPKPSVISREERVTPPPATAQSAHEIWLLRWYGNVVFFMSLVAFAALAALPHYAETGIKQMVRWVKGYAAWLRSVSHRFVVTVRWFCTWLLQIGRPPAATIWEKKGYSGNLRKFSISLLVAILLTPATIWAFYADASVMRRSLIILFGSDEDQITTQPGSVLAALTPTDGTLSADGEQPSPAAYRELTRSAPTLTKLFQTLWEEKFGFLAIALAGLQGAFGMVLLWRIDADQAVLLRPLRLLKERPLLTSCFLIFNLALALLAANRGFELSPNGVNWVLPTVISGAIALVMPWVLTFMQHYLIECLADFLSITKTITLLAVLGATVVGAMLGSALIALSLLGALAAVFAGFFFFSVACCGILCLAQLVGDVARKIHAALTPKLPLVKLASVLPAVLALLVLTAFCYYALRG